MNKKGKQIIIRRIDTKTCKPSILKINWFAKNNLTNVLILSKDEVYVYPKR